MGRCYEYIKGAHCRDDIASLTNKEIVNPIFLMSTSKTIETTITTSVRYLIFHHENSVRDPQTPIPLES